MFVVWNDVLLPHRYQRFDFNSFWWFEKIGFKTMQPHLLKNIYLWNNYTRGKTARNHPLSPIHYMCEAFKAEENS